MGTPHDNDEEGGGGGGFGDDGGNCMMILQRLNDTIVLKLPRLPRPLMTMTMVIMMMMLSMMTSHATAAIHPTLLIKKAAAIGVCL